MVETIQPLLQVGFDSLLADPGCSQGKSSWERRYDARVDDWARTRSKRGMGTCEQGYASQRRCHQGKQEGQI